MRLLLDGEVESHCSWWQEPGEFHWRFRRESDLVTVKVIEFPGLWSEAPDGEGALIFETTQPIRTLASSIAGAAGAVLAEHGFEGYRSRWIEHDFPDESLASINRLLGQ